MKPTPTRSAPGWWWTPTATPHRCWTAARAADYAAAHHATVWPMVIPAWAFAGQQPAHEGERIVPPADNAALMRALAEPKP